MGDLVTSSTPDTATRSSSRILQVEDEEDEIYEMQKSIQADLGKGYGVEGSVLDSGDEMKQYIVYVQDDGTILVDKKGILPEDADPACVIPLRLPVNKLEDPNDPLPGAIHVSYGKTKQELKEQSQLPSLQYNADTNEVIGGANQLEERDLEWVQINPADTPQEANEITQDIVKEEIKEEKLEEPAPASKPASKPASEPASEPATTSTMSTPVAVISTAVTPSTSASTTPQQTPVAVAQKSSSQATSSARARRSARQADRAEKQEAERILAESRKMLQKEKEEMESQASVKLPLNTLTPSGHVVGIAPPAIKKEEHVEDSAKKNPKRTRKLPFHLTDPNYIHPLDDHDHDQEDHDQAEEPKEEPEEEEEAEEGDDDVDDPNKLWCICRRPHNNRFMIQCDSCEDWFHGKCVGVTKAQGKVIEESEMQWHCPTCKKKIKEQDASKRLSEKKARSMGKAAENAKGSRNSTSSLEKTPGRDKKSDQSERRPSTPSPDIADPVRKSGAQKNEDAMKKTKPQKPEHKCIVCGKVARDGSVFCSNNCVMEKAKSNAPEAQQTKKDSAEDSFLSFHKLKGNKKDETVVSSSSEKHTASRSVVPKMAESQPKTGIKKFVPKPSPLAAKPSTPQKSGNSPSEAKKPPSDTKSVPTVKKPTDAIEKPRKKVESQAESHMQKPKDPSSQDSKGSTLKPPLQKQRSFEEKISQSQPQQKASESQQQHDSSKKVSEAKPRDPARTTVSTPPKPASGNQLMRSTSRNDEQKSREVQKLRKPSVEQKPAPQKPKEDPQRSSQQRPSIERKKSDTPTSSSLNSEPFLRQSMKRSLQAILQEKLKEAKTADSTQEFKANPETLAVEIEQELINCFETAGNPKCKNKFRSLLFNLKNARSTLATNLLSLTLPPSQLVRMDSSEMAPAELTEWRQRESQRELEAIKRSELDKLTEAKKQQLIEKGAEMDVVGKVAVVARQELEGVIPEPEDGKTEAGTSGESRKDKEEKSKSSKKKKHHHRDRHHREREREESSSSREKSSSSSSSSSREKASETKTDNKALKRSSSVLSDEEDPKGVWPELPIREKHDAPLLITSPRELSPSFPELPSSTVKTPDFSPPQTTSLSPLFKTTLIMPELGSLNASVFNVSHPQLEGTLFPESPVPIVGRIPPETVWDYVDKMKKSKELIVLRLAPATPQDADAYMTFFSYLASRGRLGVLGGISPPLKDVYLVPLDKHSPVNRSLLPFHGPGLPTQRAHCLLAVVTRTIESSHRLRLEVRHSKKPKIEPKSKPDPEPVSKEDEDKPYEPWEGEEEDEVTPPKEDAVALELRRLSERIAKEKQEIESILVATSRNSDLAKAGGIPGLDGEFDDMEPSGLDSIDTKEEYEPEILEVKNSGPSIVEPVESIEEKAKCIEATTNSPSVDEKMEIDESSPSPVTIMDSPPTPESPPPGLDDFRPLKKHPVEELSEDLFEGPTLKQPVGKKIEINIKGPFASSVLATQTSHGDIDERQASLSETHIPQTLPNASIGFGFQQQHVVPTTATAPPMPEAPAPQPAPEQTQRTPVPINVSVPPPNSFFMPPGLPPPGIGIAPPSGASQLPPTFPMTPMGMPPPERFPISGPQQPPHLHPPGFNTSFSPRHAPPPLSVVQHGTEHRDHPSPTTSDRDERFQPVERSEQTDRPRSGSQGRRDDGHDGQRVSRSSDAWRRHDSPRSGSGGYRPPRGDFRGRVYRNPGGERGARRWEHGARRNNRDRNRSPSPDRRDRDRDRRDDSGSRHRRRRSRSSSPRRRSRTPSPRRRSRSRSASPRRRNESPSPRRRDRSSSPNRKSISPSPPRKSGSPRRRGRSSSSSSSSSSSK